MGRRGIVLIVAENVRARRLSLGLSQERLAHNCGLHRTYIGAVERAERNITISSLERIARALSIPASALLVSGKH